MPEPILSIRDLTVEFETEDGIVHAVTDVTYDLMPGEVLGIVGESGSGKSVSMLSVLGLSPQGRIPKGEAIFKGKNLLKASQRELRDIRGGDMAMIFQDPMTSLNPVFTVGDQIAEALQVHNDGMRDDAARRFRDQAQQGEVRDRLAGARLADDAERLTPLEVEADLVDRLDDAVFAEEMRLELLHREQDVAIAIR